MAVKETKSEIDNWYFLTHDHLGSVHCILNTEGVIEQELSFDPYGNRRDPETWHPFDDHVMPQFILDRGFTFHEHWDDFALINMNGRIYDPVIGRFLSADPFIQSPDNSQGLNRYSYAWNNPLVIIDPSGYNNQWITIAVAVVAIAMTVVTYGACAGLAMTAVQMAMVCGAVGGFVGGLAGTLMNGGGVLGMH